MVTALISMSQLIGGAIGLALLAGLAAARTAAAVAQGVDASQALVDGLHAAFLLEVRPTSQSAAQIAVGRTSSDSLALGTRQVLSMRAAGFSAAFLGAGLSLITAILALTQLRAPRVTEPEPAYASQVP
jgi:hypothetical protein